MIKWSYEKLIILLKFAIYKFYRQAYVSLLSVYYYKILNLSLLKQRKE